MAAKRTFRLPILAALVFFVAVGSTVGWLLHRRSDRRETLFRTGYEQALAARTATGLDLRHMLPGEWDEIAIWTPYRDICDLGIAGYVPGSLRCRLSTDDSQCHLAFLKKNALEAVIRVSRRDADFCSGLLPPRVPRMRAAFRLSGEAEFPKVTSE